MFILVSALEIAINNLKQASMKKFIAIFSVFTFYSLVATAQLDSYIRFTEGAKPAFNINYFGVKKISEKVNLTYFGLVEKNWSEALVGVSYSPATWMSVGASTGIEHGSSIRLGGSLWFGKGKNSLLLLGEKGSGSDNYWYRANLYHKFSEKFTLGATAIRFHGVGPNLRYTVKKLNATLWLMPAYDFEFKVSRLMTGVNVKF